MNIYGWDTCIDTERGNVNGKDILLEYMKEIFVVGILGERRCLASRNVEL